MLLNSFQLIQMFLKSVGTYLEFKDFHETEYLITLSGEEIRAPEEKLVNRKKIRPIEL